MSFSIYDKDKGVYSKYDISYEETEIGRERNYSCVTNIESKVKTIKKCIIR